MSPPYRTQSGGLTIAAPAIDEETDLSTTESQEQFKNRGAWRGLGEAYGDPQAADLRAHEFLEGAADEFKLSEMTDVGRRHFLALMGAFGAVAGVTAAVNQGPKEIVSYTSQPEGQFAGIARYYASTMVDQGDAWGVLIKTREGRPIKIDGSPEHPLSRGKVSRRLQAALMDLYEPDRIKSPTSGPKPSTWQEAEKALATALASGPAVIITHSILSPTQAKLFLDLQKKFPKLEVLSYELNPERIKDEAYAALNQGAELPAADVSKADLILALECDFLGSESGATEAARQFASRRSALDEYPDQSFNRLITMEGDVSLTGLNADTRIRLHPGYQAAVIALLLDAAGAGIPEVTAKAKTLFVSLDAGSQNKINAVISEVIAAKGNVLVTLGSQMPKTLHQAVFQLNIALASPAYSATRQRRLHLPLAGAQEKSRIVERMLKGEIKTFINWDANPIFHWPHVLKLTEALAKVENTFSLNSLPSETASKCNWQLPIHQALESWNDFESRAGILSLQQPVIRPLGNSRQAEGILLALAGDQTYSETLWRNYLKSRWQSEVFSKLTLAVDFEKFWQTALHEGYLEMTSIPQKFSANSPTSTPLFDALLQKPTMSLMLKASANIGDGRYAGNGWLQEVPHPVSKVVWDNYAAISLKTARALGVRAYTTPYDRATDNIKVQLQDRSLILPVLVQPGLADDLVVIELGYGRTDAGIIAKGNEGTQVGFDAVCLLGTDESFLISGITLSKAEGQHSLVTTQEHHALDPNLAPGEGLGKLLGGDKFLANEIVKDGGMHKRRDIIQEGDTKDPDFLLKKHKHPVFSITDPLPYKGNKWAMAIDLNKCTGCSDCLVACSSENNVPVVGKDQVAVGREMHWIRLDRYYSGTPEEPDASFQPMLCQHCDNAPCENVCPVGATTHSPEGTNDMAYNRCVGTRYCANNCPYKVRRFNYYNFRNKVSRDGLFGKGHYEKSPALLAHNPEVTVRSRGVMEKCTFCVQKVMEAKQTALQEKRPLRDGDVKSSCESACPTNAIVFGDYNDINSRVRKLADSRLNYKVLDMINVKPNVNYLAKLKKKV